MIEKDYTNNPFNPSFPSSSPLSLSLSLTKKKSGFSAQFLLKDPFNLFDNIFPVIWHKSIFFLFCKLFYL